MRTLFWAVALPAATLTLCSGAEAQSNYVFVPPGLGKGISGGVALDALPPGIIRAQSGLMNSPEAVKVPVLPTPIGGGDTNRPNLADVIPLKGTKSPGVSAVPGELSLQPTRAAGRMGVCATTELHPTVFFSPFPNDFGSASASRRPRRCYTSVVGRPPRPAVGPPRWPWRPSGWSCGWLGAKRSTPMSSGV